MVNEYYPKMQQEIKAAFDNEGTVELKLFLKPEDFVKLRKQAFSVKLKHQRDVLSHDFSASKIKVDDNINKFLQSICSKKPATWEVWSFAHGDYTVINDEQLEAPGIDAIIDLTEKWKLEAGGAIVYVDGSGDYTKIVPEANKLVLVKRPQGKHRFVQYVNHKAQKNNRLFLICKIA